MTRGHLLKDRRIAVLAADGFEKVELSVPVAALRAEGAKVDIVSLRPGRIRGVNLHEPASRVAVDRTLADASAGKYDALLAPGGFINPDLLRQSSDARRFVSEFDAAGKPIAAFVSDRGDHGGRFPLSIPCKTDMRVTARASIDTPSNKGCQPWMTSLTQAGMCQREN